MKSIQIIILLFCGNHGLDIFLNLADEILESGVGLAEVLCGEEFGNSLAGAVLEVDNGCDVDFFLFVFESLCPYRSLHYATLVVIDIEVVIGLDLLEKCVSFFCILGLCTGDSGNFAVEFVELDVTLYLNLAEYVEGDLGILACEREDALYFLFFSGLRIGIVDNIKAGSFRGELKKEFLVAPEGESLIEGASLEGELGRLTA